MLRETSGRKPRLFHFSEEPDIAYFEPRAPLRHPDTEPLVYAISETYSPLYFFPRDCPRIAIYDEAGPHRLLIDRTYESQWRSAKLYQYEFDPADGFIDCHDHGAFISRQTVTPISVTPLTDLPAMVKARSIEIEVVDSLIAAAHEFYDFERRMFIVSDHVSMIRMSLLPGWPGGSGRPVFAPCA